MIDLDPYNISYMDKDWLENLGWLRGNRIGTKEQSLCDMLHGHMAYFMLLLLYVSVRCIGTAHCVAFQKYLVSALRDIDIPLALIGVYPNRRTPDLLEKVAKFFEYYGRSRPSIKRIVKYRYKCRDAKDNPGDLATNTKQCIKALKAWILQERLCCGPTSRDSFLGACGWSPQRVIDSWLPETPTDPIPTYPCPGGKALLSLRAYKSEPLDVRHEGFDRKQILKLLQTMGWKAKTKARSRPPSVAAAPAQLQQYYTR